MFNLSEKVCIQSYKRLAVHAAAMCYINALLFFRNPQENVQNVLKNVKNFMKCY